MASSCFLSPCTGTTGTAEREAFSPRAALPRAGTHIPCAHLRTHLCMYTPNWPSRNSTIYCWFVYKLILSFQVPLLVQRVWHEWTFRNHFLELYTVNVIQNSLPERSCHTCHTCWTFARSNWHPGELFSAEKMARVANTAMAVTPWRKLQGVAQRTNRMLRNGCKWGKPMICVNKKVGP